MSDGMSDSGAGGFCDCGPGKEICGLCQKLRWTKAIALDRGVTEVCEECEKAMLAKLTEALLAASPELPPPTGEAPFRVPDLRGVRIGGGGDGGGGAKDATGGNGGPVPEGAVAHARAEIQAEVNAEVRRDIEQEAGLRSGEMGVIAASAKKGKSLLQEIAKGPTIQLDDELSDYRRQREALAAKFGRLIPIAEGVIVACDIGQEVDADALVRITIKTATFDQLAIMAAPNHRMKVLLFEDRRKR